MKNNSGFTLIEILIVIGIIGILAAFLIPSFMGVQDKAKEAAVKSVMRSVQYGVESYNMENETYPIAKDITLKNLYENYLAAGVYMSGLPKNPFTGKLYADGDSAGKIMYTYEDTTGKYVITGYKRNGITKILELTNM
ncbi:MAG: prepilin-type N-terminal cleavage/methylation domain-containing protein [Candidatus Margulisiibacteriota bacterium]